MIPRASITEWARVVPWPTVEQVEQDLLLSRLLIEIASDDYLGSELVFRGGTCLHKLHAPTPLRYSEDLDYVRRTAGPITQVVDAIRGIGETLGMTVNTSITRHPKIYLRAPFETGGDSMRLKVEVNTFERSPSNEPIRVAYRIDSSWFAGGADVLTFTVNELVATKIRALYERSKGRDLFDLWLAMARLGVPASSIAQAFAPYRPES